MKKYTMFAAEHISNCINNNGSFNITISYAINRERYNPLKCDVIFRGMDQYLEFINQLNHCNFIEICQECPEQVIFIRVDDIISIEAN